MVTKLRFATLALFAVGVGSASVACANVLGFERLEELTASEEAGVDAGNEAAVESDAAPSACGEIGTPTMPAPSDGGTSLDPILMAIKKLDFGIEVASEAPGFNLDKTCTSDLASSSCTTNVDETTFATYIHDVGNTGVDNAGVKLISKLASLGSAFKPSEINQRLKDAEYGFVFRLSRWNGLPDDDDVTVEIFPALGVWEELEDGGLAFTRPPAGFDEDDLWVRDTRFRLLDRDASQFQTVTAWVKDGKVAGFFAGLTMPISVPDDEKPFDIILREAWFTGDLAGDGAGYKLANGIIGGRWQTIDFLDQVRQIYLDDTLGVQNAYICNPGIPQSVYAAVRSDGCSGRDLRGSSREDGQGLPCNAVSVAARFESYWLKSPGEFHTLDIAARCTDVDDLKAGDDCPTSR